MLENIIILKKMYDLGGVPKWGACPYKSQKGVFMRKGIARKCLLLALSSALVLGGTVTALAAENETATDQVSIAATDEGQTAAETPYLTSYSTDNYSDSCSYRASGYAYKAELWINGVKQKTITNTSDNQWFDMYYSVGKLYGVGYTAKMALYDMAGNRYVTVIGKTAAVSPKVNRVTTTQNYTVSEKGIRKPISVSLNVEFDAYYNNEVHYQVFRANSAKGPYTKLADKSASYTSTINYVDSSANPGNTYYYKIRLVTGTNEVCKTNKVIYTSGATGVKVGKPSGYVSVYSYEDGDKTAASISCDSDFANRYDIYRSLYKTKGFKLVKTVYSSSYYDKGLKRGTVYYYKIVPKYYDSETGKTIVGNASSVAATKYIMSSSYPYLNQVTNTSMECTWSSAGTSGVTYEVWARRTDLVGTAFKRLAVTKNASYTLKNLAANGTYEVKIRAVKVSGGVARYETSDSSELTMGYTDYVQRISCYAKNSAMDSTGKIMTVSYNLSWYRDWGASGYIISALNSYTGKMEVVKKITSGTTTSCVLYNKGTVDKGRKYERFYIKPYKGKVVGNDSDVYAYSAPCVKNVKVARKTGNSAVITWTGVKGATKYMVYRNTELGVSQYIGESSTTSFVDTHLTNGLYYSYTVYVKETKGGFEMDYGTGYYGYVHKLGTPTISGVSNSAAGVATVKWGTVPNAKKYYVYRSETKTGTYKLAGTTASLSFANKSLVKGKTYYYKVVAVTVNEGGKTVKSVASAAKGVRITK